MEQNFINFQSNRLSSKLGLDLSYFVKGGFWLTLSTIASFAGGIFLSSLFARIWPPDVYGQFSFLMSALGFISLTALPGMGQALTQAVSEGKDGSYKLAMETVFKWSLSGMLLLFLGSIYFYLRQNPNLALATFVSALAFPITSATGLYTSFLTGKKQFKNLAIFSIIAQYTSITATAFTLWKMPNFFLVAFFSAWSTALMGILLSIIAYKKVANNKIDPTTRGLGFHLSFSQVFTISADYIDRFLVPLILGFTSNAIYAFAILIPMQIHTLFKVLLSLGQPKIAAISEKNLFRDLVVKTIQLEIPIAILVGIYILMAPTIFKILYPTYFESATFLSQIFALSLLYYPSNLFGLAFVKMRETRLIYTMNIAYAISSIISLLLLINLFGLPGAVFAKIVVRLFQGITQYLLFARMYNKITSFYGKNT